MNFVKKSCVFFVIFLITHRCLGYDLCSDSCYYVDIDNKTGYSTELYAKQWGSYREFYDKDYVVDLGYKTHTSSIDGVIIKLFAAGHKQMGVCKQEFSPALVTTDKPGAVLHYRLLLQDGNIVCQQIITQGDTTEIVNIKVTNPS